jgi:hypothetical protein
MHAHISKNIYQAKQPHSCSPLSALFWMNMPRTTLQEAPAFAFVGKVPLSFASLAATSGDTGFVQRERAPPVDSPVVRSPDFGPHLSPDDQEHERRCDTAVTALLTFGPLPRSSRR